VEFLKKLAEQGSEEAPPNAVQIRRVVQMTIQCDSCDYWGKMSGGQTVKDEGQGAFECPKCETIKYVKWMFNS